MRTGTSHSAHRRYQGGIRPALIMVFAAIALFAFTYPDQASASDRDTPAYMIYVDPITGKYSTRPPEDSTGASDTSAINTQGSNNSGTVITAVQTNTTDTIMAPIIAVLLLTAAAFVSLLLKGKQSF